MSKHLEARLFAFGLGGMALAAFVPALSLAAAAQAPAVGVEPMLAQTLVTGAAVGGAVYVAWAGARSTFAELRRALDGLRGGLVRLGEGQRDIDLSGCGLVADVAEGIGDLREKVHAQLQAAEQSSVRLNTRVAALEDALHLGGEEVCMPGLLVAGARRWNVTVMRGDQRRVVVRAPGLALPSGLVGTLMIRPSPSAIPFEADVEVENQFDSPGLCALILRWREPARLFGAPPELFAVLERRRDFRVPVPKQQLEVDLVVSGSAPFPTEVHDVSMGGVALLVPDEPSAVLEWGDTVILRLRFAGQTFRIPARVRNVCAATGGARVGLAFELRGDAWATLRSPLHALIRSRVELLRAGGISIYEASVGA